MKNLFMTIMLFVSVSASAQNTSNVDLTTKPSEIPMIELRSYDVRVDILKMLQFLVGKEVSETPVGVVQRFSVRDLSCQGSSVGIYAMGRDHIDVECQFQVDGETKKFTKNDSYWVYRSLRNAGLAPSQLEYVSKTKSLSITCDFTPQEIIKNSTVECKAGVQPIPSQQVTITAATGEIQQMGSTINIINPVLDQGVREDRFGALQSSRWALNPDRGTAESACQMLGLKYVSYTEEVRQPRVIFLVEDSGYGSAIKLKRDGSFEIHQRTNRFMKTLTCK